MIEHRRRTLSVWASWIALMLMLQGLCCPLTLEASVQTGDRDDAIYVGSLRRVYHLHVPSSYDGTKPTPLVLVFHGLLETSLDMGGMTGFSQLADQKGFIVVYPESIGRHWNDGRGTTAIAPRDADDVGFVLALIEHLTRTLAIDSARVYATGMSNGAMFSQRLACELSEHIAAIGPVSGTMAANIAARCTPSQPVSVVEFHGTRDAFVPWHGGQVRGLGGKVLSVPETMARWAQLNGCGPPPPPMIAEPPRHAQGGMWVLREGYGPCQAGSDVALYSIEGGRHFWPRGLERTLPLIGRVSRPINVTHVIWDFFETHPKLRQVVAAMGAQGTE